MTATTMKTYAAEMKAAKSQAGETTFTATITTAAIDRDNEVVIPAGMNAKHYEQNPVLLYAHDPARPIGKMLSLRRGESAIDADFALAPRPATHEGEWLPDTIGALIKFGALRGVSVSFKPMDGGVRNATKADRERFGQTAQRVYSKWLLLEVSIVAIPSNQDALISAVSKGIVTAAAAKSICCSLPSIPELPAAVVAEVKHHRITIAVPSIGADAVRIAARRELARLRGRFRA